MISFVSDKIIWGEKLIKGAINVENGKIESLTDLPKSNTIYDYTGKYISAGFIDIHTHGAGGHPFMNGSCEEVLLGVDFHLKHGTTTIVPTVSACAFPEMEKAVKDISLAKKSGKSKANILGAHMEGPYLSKEQCGAQCPTFITEPKKEEYTRLIEKYKGDIIRWTFAPENDKGGEFCKYLTDNNIIASAGHSNAKYCDLKVAMEKGCNLITHLYSCTSTVTREKGFRSLGIIETAFLEDNLNVEIIADGKHLPVELIKMIIKIKGTDRVILITDSLEIAGTDIKEGVMSGTEFIVEDGVCKLKDRSAFAGSIATADRLIRVLVKDCGYSIPVAVKMMTENPAKLLKVNKGKIEKGYDADFVIFDDDIQVKDVFVSGEKI